MVVGTPQIFLVLVVVVAPDISSLVLHTIANYEFKLLPSLAGSSSLHRPNSQRYLPNFTEHLLAHRGKPLQDLVPVDTGHLGCTFHSTIAKKPGSRFSLLSFNGRSENPKPCAEVTRVEFDSTSS